jgi:hypothetical protein
MNSIAVVATLTLAALSTSAAAQECRWMGDGVQACKDGKGHWRRVGDEEIVGTYPLSRPKPAPAQAPPPVAAPPASPTIERTQDADVEPFITSVEAAFQSNGASVAQEPASETAESAPEPAAPEPPKPWWRSLLDGIWGALQTFLRSVGLIR